jgi:hypothetical protein
MRRLFQQQAHPAFLGTPLVANWVGQGLLKRANLLRNQTQYHEARRAS